ncbi:MAG: type II toxin-antitoxin system VapC family toxin [Microvirga sp.]
MSVYLDASILVALFTPDTLSARVDANFRSTADAAVVGDFAAAEFASAVARKVRTGELTEMNARAVFSEFDEWVARLGAMAEVRSADLVMAARFLRRLDLNLRAPDALNIAVAQRLGIAIATFDQRMAVAARRLGVPTARL